MSRPRLAFHTWPAAVYAIGDVHGCLDQLKMLEEVIAEDGLNFEGEKWLVTVGDHVRVLGPGEAYYFESRVPHRFRNVGDEEAVLVSANTPPTF